MSLTQLTQQAESTLGSDDRKVCFVPEAGEEFFSQDDAHRLVGMLHKGTEALEWGLSSSERHPGKGPYDTGAV